MSYHIIYGITVAGAVLSKRRRRFRR